MSSATLSSARIILGVSGGIAAYKSAELVRRLRDAGAQVRVVMTASAERFITPLTFQALSGNSVRDSLWDDKAEAAMGHIELARWASHIVIAPASADLMARMVAGMADDLLSTLCLASSAPVYLAPAMNQQMWANAATQANLKVLQQRGVHILGPASGDQACGDVGMGRMVEAHEIVDALAREPRDGFLRGLTVVVSAGPTLEDIDPVRFLGNRSSGRMGYAIADAALQAGAKVVLVSGPVSLATPIGVERVNVRSAAQMHAAVFSACKSAHIYIAAAAVADYRPATIANNKIKKSASNKHLELVPTADILADLGASKSRPFLVGFAAETEQVENYARGKLERKGMDMIAANPVGREGVGFDCSDNELHVIWADGEHKFATASKTELARDLVALIHKRYNAMRGSNLGIENA